MSFVARPYQAEAIGCGLDFLRTTQIGVNGLLVEPTGSGKSLVIAEIVRQLDGPAIIFQPSVEILEQNLMKLLQCGCRPAVYSSSFNQSKVGDITLATIGSVVRKAHLFERFKYILIDEAHLVGAKNESSMFMQFLTKTKEAKVLGLTATPYRLSHDGFGGAILKFITRTRPRVFHKVVHVTQNGDLLRDGYWAKLEYKVVKTGFRTDRLRINSTGADYTDESVRQHFKELSFPDKIVRCVQRVSELDRGPVLVFTRFVEEAEYVARKVGGAVVTADTPKDTRKAIVRQFRAGQIKCVANVNCLAIGFDYPELANVILAAPTRSLARYYQWVGRTVRPHPSKESAFVIDMVGLVEKFGRVEDFRLVCGPHDTWRVETDEGKVLTNVYFDKPDRWRAAEGLKTPVLPFVSKSRQFASK